MRDAQADLAAPVRAEAAADSEHIDEVEACAEFLAVVAIEGVHHRHANAPFHEPRRAPLVQPQPYEWHQCELRDGLTASAPAAQVNLGTRARLRVAETGLPVPRPQRPRRDAVGARRRHPTLDEHRVWRPSGRMRQERSGACECKQVGTWDAETHVFECHQLGLAGGLFQDAGAKNGNALSWLINSGCRGVSTQSYNARPRVGVRRLMHAPLESITRRARSSVAPQE